MVDSAIKKTLFILGFTLAGSTDFAFASCPNGPLSGSRQVILSISAEWGSPEVLVQRFNRESDTAAWSDVDPAPHAGMVGRRGMGWGRGLHPNEGTSPKKREGDGRAPAGVFDLSDSFGSRSDVHSPDFPYHVADSNGRCVDEGSSSHYNEVIYDQRTIRRDYNSNTVERLLRSDGLYEYAVVVDHNQPPVRGGGSCIFMHVWRGPGQPTSGCTAMPADQMRKTVEWLDASQRPRIVQLPLAEYLRHKEDWCLPDMDVSPLAVKIIDARIRDLLRPAQPSCESGE